MTYRSHSLTVSVFEPKRRACQECNALPMFQVLKKKTKQSEKPASHTAEPDLRSHSVQEIPVN